MRSWYYKKNCYTNYVPAFGVDFKTSKNLQIVKKKKRTEKQKVAPTPPPWKYKNSN